MANSVTKFAVYLARILLGESCKFGEKIFYSNCDDEFFLRDCFFYWRTLFTNHTVTMTPHFIYIKHMQNTLDHFCRNFARRRAVSAGL